MSLQGMLLGFIGLRFPALEDLAKKQAAALDQPQALEALMVQTVLAQSVEEAEKYLIQSTQDQSNSH